MKDGWGLATDGQVLFGSDGTSTLYRMDPRTMKGFEFYSLLLSSSTTYLFSGLGSIFMILLTLQLLISM